MQQLLSDQPLNRSPPDLGNRVIPRPVGVITVVGEGGGGGEDGGVKEIDDDRPVLTGAGTDRRVVAVNLVAHAQALGFADAGEGGFAGVGWVGDDRALGLVIEQGNQDSSPGGAQIGQDRVEIGAEMLLIGDLILGAGVVVLVEIPEIIAANPDDGHLGATCSSQQVHRGGQLRRLAIQPSDQISRRPSRMAEVREGRAGTDGGQFCQQPVGIATTTGAVITLSLGQAVTQRNEGYCARWQGRGVAGCGRGGGW